MAVDVMYGEDENQMKKAILKEYDCCLFSEQELLTRFLSHHEFRKAIMTGAYLYQDNRLVLCREDLLDFSEEKIKLAQKVEDCPQKYCLSQYKLKVVSPTEQGARNIYIRKAANLSMRRISYIPVPVVNDGPGVRKQIHISHAKEISNKVNINHEKVFKASFTHACAYVNNGNNDNPNLTFQQLFTMYMDNRGMSNKDLADITNIDPKTIRRMKNEEDYHASLDYVVMCCLAMKLHYSESNALLYAGGYLLRGTIKKERAYQVLLQTYYGIGEMPIYNKMLEMMGVESFASIIEKEKAKHKNK